MRSRSSYAPPMSFAEAQTLTLLCDLAEHYDVDYDQVLEVLAECKVVVGGIGTPAVSEFIGLELAGLLRCPPIVAASRLADALNLKHRHPRLYAAVQEGRVEAGRACKAADLCWELRAEAADAVTSGNWRGGGPRPRREGTAGRLQGSRTRGRTQG